MQLYLKFQHKVIEMRENLKRQKLLARMWKMNFHYLREQLLLTVKSCRVRALRKIVDGAENRHEAHSASPYLYRKQRWQRADTQQHAGMLSLSLSFCVLLVESERRREFLTYCTVTIANAIGQQCRRVHVARVRPLIPHVFSHPSRPMPLPSNEIWLYRRPDTELNFRESWCEFLQQTIHLPGTLPCLAFRA